MGDRNEKLVPRMHLEFWSRAEIAQACNQRTLYRHASPVDDQGAARRTPCRLKEIYLRELPEHTARKEASKGLLPVSRRRNCARHLRLDAQIHLVELCNLAHECRPGDAWAPEHEGLHVACLGGVHERESRT